MATIVDATSETYNWSISPSVFLSTLTESQWKDVLSSTTASYYCGEGWRTFREGFNMFHGIASVIVCIFGMLTNILNIIVLTRKDMVSATNYILTGLAVADMLVMMDYLPFALQMYVLDGQPCEMRYSYGWAVFTLFHANFSVVCHTISIALTLTLAVWRFIAVSYPQNTHLWCNIRRSHMAIMACYAFAPIFCFPIYLSFEIKKHTILEDCREHNGTGVFYTVNFSTIAMVHNKLLKDINFWVYSILIKIFPCIVLTVLSTCLIRALYQANQRKLLLHNRKVDNADRSCDRTTRMLLAVLLLFLITEFPQGILALLSGLIDGFFESCYSYLSEVMDFLALINSAINFILYCVMSRQFRNTFSRMFKPKILNNWIALPQEPITQATTCV